MPMILVIGLMLMLAMNAAMPAELASYYGWFHHGRITASGKPFNALNLTAAHRTLPLGTRVKVTNLRNGRSVVVVINDRGPALRTGRSIDLSLGAARALGMIRDGVVPVAIQVISRGN